MNRKYVVLSSIENAHMLTESGDGAFLQYLCTGILLELLDESVISQDRFERALSCLEQAVQ